MIRLKFSNGTSGTYRDTDTLSVRSAPVSDVRKTGYEKTRDYTPEWSKFTPIMVKRRPKQICLQRDGKYVCRDFLR